MSKNNLTEYIELSEEEYYELEDKLQYIRRIWVGDGTYWELYRGNGKRYKSRHLSEFPEPGM